jgi:hypothetical protein
VGSTLGVKVGSIDGVRLGSCDGELELPGTTDGASVNGAAVGIAVPGVMLGIREGAVVGAKLGA